MDSSDERPVPAFLARWTACPVCGGELEVEIDEPGAQPHLVCQGECGSPWFSNPKPTVNVFAERADDGRLLLVRRGRDPFKGYWDIPGGFMEDGEEAEEGARRELREETGLEVRLTEWVGVFDDRYGGDRGDHTVNMFWRGIVDEPDVAEPASDVSELAWFSHDELPPDADLAFACVARAVARWRELGAAG